MTAPNKVLFRRIRSQLGSFISTVIIVAVAVGFYLVLKTITDIYQTTSENYYSKNVLADYALSGQFDNRDIAKIQSLENIETIVGRTVVDGKSGDATIRVIGMPKDSKINVPHIYEGSEFKNINECLLSKKYADVNNLGVGDDLDFMLSGQNYHLKISGLVASPEYVYLAKSVLMPMVNPKEFGVIFAMPDFYANQGITQYNELVFTFKDINSEDQTISQIKTLVGNDKISQELKQKDFLSYSFYKDDLEQLDTFSYIFPIVFFIIAGIVILVVQKRNIIHDRRQIGIMKALGLHDREIFWFYTKYAILLAIVGISLGLVLSITIGPIILNMFGRMFEVPGFTYQSIFSYWVIPIVISLLTCVLSNFFAIKDFSQIAPAEAMHAEQPRSGKDILLQKTSFWNSLSFNSRYSIKSALRNTGRFWAVVLGMVATITLAIFSFGFMDTFDEIISGYYSKVANYDLSITTAKMPIHQTPSFLASNGLRDYDKALIMPVKIENNGKIEDISLYLSNDIFSMHRIKNLSGKDPDLENGVAIPRRFAKLLGVSKGNEIKIYSTDKKIDKVLVVSDITDQTTGFYALATFDFAKKKLDQPNLFYNTIFAKATGDINAIKNNIEKERDVLSVTSKSEDKKSLDKMLDVFRVYIYILIFFAIVLGIAVLYSISTINLLSRNYEFVVLKVMGYSTKDILFAYTKELLGQMIIAIPIGFVLGYLVLMSVNQAFSTESFEMVNSIYPESYLYAILLLLGIIGVVLMNANRQVNKLDLVEGLKSKEE